MNKETFHVRVPPQDLEAEQSVLGAMMMSERAIHEVATIVKSDDFYREANREIFKGIQNLTAKGEPVDVITLQNELKRMGEFDKAGGLSALMQLIERVPTAANVEYYAEIVKQHSRRRGIIKMASRAVDLAYEGELYPNEILENLVSEVITEENFSEVVEPHQMAGRAYEMVTSETKPLYIPTGWKEFDEKIHGIKRGVVTTVTGESETGKSTGMQNVALSMAKRGFKVVYVYLEDSPYQLAKRQVCMMRGWAIDRLESTDPKVLDFTEKSRAFSDWADLGIRVCSRKQVGLQFKTMKLWMLREFKKHKPDIFFIDGGERLLNQPIYGESRWDAQERMVGEMEDLAQSLEVGFVVIVGQAKTSKLAKQNNFVDENEGGTNAWRKLARMRLLVNWHPRADSEKQFENISVVKVTKNSDGPKASFWFRGERQNYRWREYEGEATAE